MKQQQPRQPRSAPIKIESVKLGEPTHFSKRLDERGMPSAGTPESLGDGNTAGELPPGWHPNLWDWQPRGDPKGAWVQLVEKKRAEMWEQVKAARAKAQDAGVKVRIGNKNLPFDSDEASANVLAQIASTATAEPVEFTLANDTTELLRPADITKALSAIVTHRMSVHARSQQIRAALNDPANDTLEKLGAIDTSF